MRQQTNENSVPAPERRLPPGFRDTKRDPVRPPWSWDEKEFLAACTRCDACMAACPSGIIVRPGDGFPEIDFIRGECTFCGECVARCKPGALVRAHQGSTPWLLKAAISQDCLARHRTSCTACANMCSRGAIRFKLRGGSVAIPEIDRRSCKGCGACLGWCPESAITLTSTTARRNRQAVLPR